VKAIIGKYLFPLANAFKYSVKVKAYLFYTLKKVQSEVHWKMNPKPKRKGLV